MTRTWCQWYPQHGTELEDLNGSTLRALSCTAWGSVLARALLASSSPSSQRGLWRPGPASDHQQHRPSLVLPTPHVSATQDSHHHQVHAPAECPRAVCAPADHMHTHAFHASSPPHQPAGGTYRPVDAAGGLALRSTDLLARNSSLLRASRTRSAVRRSPHKVDRLPVSRPTHTGCRVLARAPPLPPSLRLCRARAMEQQHLVRLVIAYKPYIGFPKGPVAASQAHPSSSACSRTGRRLPYSRHSFCFLIHVAPRSRRTIDSASSDRQFCLRLLHPPAAPRSARSAV